LCTIVFVFKLLIYLVIPKKSPPDIFCVNKADIRFFVKPFNYFILLIK